jgi:hypothetical protein
MLDPARLLEARRVYRDLIPLFSRWGYNSVFWHFLDDQGCALKFPRRPELASLNAYSAAEMRELVRFAQKHGIAIVPEVECFGHTGCIVSLKKYSHLRDGLPGKMFGALCPFHDDARALLKDLLTDAAEIFDSEYIHVGLDEIGFGGNPLTQRLLQSKKKYELFADHVNWLHSVVTGLGRKMMMWGDHLRQLPESSVAREQFDTEAITEKITDLISKDIIICDWQYGPNPGTAHADMLLSKGFRVVVCPGTVSWGTLIQPREWNRRSLYDFPRVGAERRERGVIGVVNTVWCPYRYLTGTTLYGMALGGESIRTGGQPGKDFGERFVRETFGIQRPQGVAGALDSLCTHAVLIRTLSRALPRDRKEVEETTAEHLAELKKVGGLAARAAKQLSKAARQVKTNKLYFDDIVFSAKCVAAVAPRAKRLKALVDQLSKASKLADAGKAAAARTLAQRVRKQLKPELRLAQQHHREGLRLWSKTRFANDPKRDGVKEGFTLFDSFLQRLRGTVEVLKELDAAAAKV